MNFFDSSNAELHLTLSQMKSRIKAAKIKDSDFKMISSDSCEIVGSAAEPYRVTLSSCTCPDFKNNKKKQAPCLHIYRLASELNVLDLPVIDEAAKAAFDLEFSENLKIWKNAFLDGRITAERYASLLEAFSK